MPTRSMLEIEAMTGAVLAGGAGRRMGGVDKGLVDLAGRPLVSWTLDALRPQVGSLLINANRSLEQYRALGWPVVADAGDGFQGPLAGTLAVLTVAKTEYVLTVPCDAPRVPGRLAARLAAALQEAGADIAVAHANGRRQSVHALIRRDLRDGLAVAVADGERKMAVWQDAQRCVVVDCDDLADGFVNINTPAECDALARILEQDDS